MFIKNDYPFFPYNLKSDGIGFCLLASYTVCCLWHEMDNGQIRIKIMLKLVDNVPWWIKDTVPNMKWPAPSWTHLPKFRLPLLLEVHVTNYPIIRRLLLDELLVWSMQISDKQFSPYIVKKACWVSLCKVWQDNFYLWSRLICDSCGNSVTIKPSLNIEIRPGGQVGYEVRDDKVINMYEHTFNLNRRLRGLNIFHLESYELSLDVHDAMEEASRLLDEYISSETNQSLTFKRTPLRSHRCHGTMFTNYFSYNGSDGSTVLWEETPMVIHDAKKHMLESLNAIFDNVLDFNEIMSMAYLKGQSMAVIFPWPFILVTLMVYYSAQFHSDDEKGVYPFVAGLSLGSDALMKFQKRPSPRKPLTRPILTVNLQHGDILLMDGIDFQSFFHNSFWIQGSSDSWQKFLNFTCSLPTTMTTLADPAEDTMILQPFVIDNTKPDDINKINNAIKDYVKKRMELESDGSSAQWDLVNAAQNMVIEALQALQAARVIKGRALWDGLPSEPAQIQAVGADTVTQTVQSTKPNAEKKLSAADTPTGSAKDVRSTKPRPRAVKGHATTSAIPSTLGIHTHASMPKLLPKPRELQGTPSSTFLSYTTPPEEPSVEWLTQLWDLAIDLGPANKDEVISKLGLELWCQLIFLNIHHSNSRTLSKTKVSKVDISTWDLIPTEADTPCKTCGHKLPCQWPNSEDRSKCWECHLQAKHCMFSGSGMKRGRKRKRNSESPSTARRHVKMDLDVDEDDEVDSQQDETLEQPAENLSMPPQPRPTLNLQKMDLLKSPATRSSTSKLSHPTKVTPFWNSSVAKRIAQLTPIVTVAPHPSSSSSLNPETPTPSSEILQTRPDESPPATMPPILLNERYDNEMIENESIITRPMLSIPANRPLTIHDSRSPTPSTDDPSKNTFPTFMNSFFDCEKTNISPAGPHGHPDHNKYDKLVEKIKDWDIDTCKRHLARVMADLHCAIGNMRELHKQLNELLKKDKALLVFVLEIDAAHQKAVKELTQLRSGR
ncbi:uncharacterized protein EV420DRAFT_1633895 [Desarmillaria tabescens]|uniref:Alpha-ketoglutarate-dependent dioxygenase AlkB-like domain-containing protein n=1 Tax=Armillaria tabescens TaxID=1929756 RepID=A0AA39U2Q7_ARMTA|nr:uncharacterized protein EV420DRAFT_1633895 [Desarmillaria tabescens]KAK0469469.1 hypothetical protein EV420DRAFT_1633895 [Desarmillaria tabescens]